MSHEEDKVRHSKRLLRDEAAIKKQLKIAKRHRVEEYNPQGINEPHRYAKTHSMTCGNSNCVMCGNPRKFYKGKTKEALTYQEQKMMQDLGEE